MTRVGLVLGAGGITGFAYHSGALSALRHVTGWDPRTAEVIVGTSAGSSFAATLRGGVAVDDVLAHLLATPANPETMARLRVLSGRETSLPSWWWFGPSSPGLLVREMARPWRLRAGRIGAAILPPGRIPTELLGDRARALHGLDWPSDALWVCALRLDDGSRVVFGRDSGDSGGTSSDASAAGVDVGTAVEASCAIPGFFRPVVIGGVRHVDGAVHSPTNADLMADHDLDLVVVLSPMSASCGDAARSFDAPVRLRCAQQLAGETALLRRRGLEVLVLEPDRDVLRAMGAMSMDPTRMVPTVLQASASTLDQLDQLDGSDLLAMLVEATATSTSPPDVPFPGDTGWAARRAG